MTFRRYSSKYVGSNVNQVDFGKKTFWTCYCCSLLKCKSRMLSLTGTCCLAICPFFFFFFVPLKFRFSFLYVCPASVLLLLLSTQCTPACSTLTFAAVLHPSKLRSSMRPLLDCVQLTALRPRGSPGQWPSTKAPGASSTSATKFPAAQGDSRSKSHSPAKHTLYIHTDARTH